MPKHSNAQYELVAKAFDITKPVEPSIVQLTTWTADKAAKELHFSSVVTERLILAMTLARLFEEDNPLFNRERFLDACSVKARTPLDGGGNIEKPTK